MHIIFTFILLCIYSFSLYYAQESGIASITPYPSISAFDNSALFSVTANSIPILVPIIATYHTSSLTAKADGSIIIQVTSLSGPIQLFSLAPPIQNGGATVSGNVLTFQVTAPIKVEVRFNLAVTSYGDTTSSTVLYLIVDLPENQSQIPSPSDSDTLYFSPGIYNLGLMLYNATNPPPSQIYAAPGALVNAAWRFVGVQSVTISGRGIFRNPFQNIIIRDIYLVDSPQHVIALSSGSVGNSICSHFLIDNIKSIHRGGNSDGFSFFGPVNNVLVQNVLLVNVDNQIVLQAGLPTGPYDNTFQNNVFVKSSSGGNFMILQSPSNPKANDIEFGTIGSNNLFTSFDILRLSGSAALVQYSGANKVDGITLDNIRVVSFGARSRGANKNLFLDLSSNDLQHPKSMIFKNCAFPSFPVGFNGSVIAGNWVVSFENISIGGVPLTDNSQIGFNNVDALPLTHFN